MIILEECKQLENLEGSSRVLKGKWSSAEDTMLKSIVCEKHSNWVEVAKKLPGRNAKQCRDRWLYHLNPNVNKSKFTDEEDEKIMELYHKLGGKWIKIVKLLGNGRNENMVRSRILSLLRAEEKYKKLSQSKKFYMLTYFLY